MARLHLSHLYHVFQVFNEKTVNFIGKTMFFVKLSDLHIRVYFGVVDNLVVPVLIGTSFIDRFPK